MNYTKELYKVMRPKIKKAPHILIFINGEYKFNGINYKGDERGANDARRIYYEQLKNKKGE